MWALPALTCVAQNLVLAIISIREVEWPSADTEHEESDGVHVPSWELELSCGGDGREARGTATTKQAWSSSGRKRSIWPPAEHQQLGGVLRVAALKDHSSSPEGGKLAAGRQHWLTPQQRT